MTTIALDPVSKAHVMYDILNEPDCRSIGWEGGGSGRSMVRCCWLSLLSVLYMFSPVLPSCTGGWHYALSKEGPGCCAHCTPP